MSIHPSVVLVIVQASPLSSPTATSMPSLDSIDESREHHQQQYYQQQPDNRETSGDFTDSVVTEKPPRAANVTAHSPTEKEKLLAYYANSDGPGCSQLARNTRAALKRGIDSRTAGDEGYAAWLQYREVSIWDGD